MNYQKIKSPTTSKHMGRPMSKIFNLLGLTDIHKLWVMPFFFITFWCPWSPAHTFHQGLELFNHAESSRQSSGVPECIPN